MKDINEYPCELFDFHKYKDGPHVHEGHVLHRYGGIAVCSTCWNGNEDGWSPNCEERLLRILKEKGLKEPPRNANGWLPRE